MSQLKNALILYETYSGNTQEVAEIVEEELVARGVEVVMHRNGVGILPTLSSFEIILMGTYTWEKGSVPNELKDTIADIGYKPNNMVIYGTGDTQFGGDALFCLAVDKLVKFYDSKYTPLKIEQSPRGTQEQVVRSWAGELYEEYRSQKGKD